MLINDSEITPHPKKIFVLNLAVQTNNVFVKTG